MRRGLVFLSVMAALMLTFLIMGGAVRYKNNAQSSYIRSIASHDQS